jgi:competence protein ComEA
MITRLVLLFLLLAPMARAEPGTGSNPEPVASTAASTVASAPLPTINLNSATVAELCTLPGIGPKKAEAIVALRTRRPLTRVTQLLQVKGIGPKTLQRLKPRLSVAPTPAAVAASRS